MIQKFFHICSTSTLVDNDDQAGSVVYPVSSIRSIGIGSMATTGVITGSETVYHIALDPICISKGAGIASGTKSDNVDVINITMTTANNAKAHMQELIQKINSFRKTEGGFIDLFDGVNGTKLIADIDSISNSVNAN